MFMVWFPWPHLTKIKTLKLTHALTPLRAVFGITISVVAQLNIHTGVSGKFILKSASFCCQKHTGPRKRVFERRNRAIKDFLQFHCLSLRAEVGPSWMIGHIMGKGSGGGGWGGADPQLCR